MKLTVLIENTSQNSLISEHGLSFHIHHNNKTYLLDTGKSDAFMKNADMLNIDLDVDYCILSHGHYDHGGGYARYLSLYDKYVYAMKTAFDTYCSSDDKHVIGLPENVDKDKFILIDTITNLEQDVYLIPHSQSLEDVGKRSKMYRYVNNEYIYDDFSHELSLVFDTEKGLVILNSCSHGGVRHIIDDVRGVLPDKHIYAFVGGLHLKGKNNTCAYSKKEVHDIACYLLDNVDILYTGHCTGDIGYSYLKEYMGDRVLQLYSGKEIEL